MTERGKSAVMADAVRASAAEVDAQRRAAEGEQLDFLPVPTRHTGARADHLQRALEQHHRGRPPGAQNKSTEEFRKYLLSRGSSPLATMMAWAQHTPTSLAAELGCSRERAFELLLQMWRELAPYLHQQMPRAIEVDGATAGILILGDLTPKERAQVAETMGVSALTLSADQYQEKQEVSGDEIAPSHDNRRTEEPK